MTAIPARRGGARGGAGRARPDRARGRSRPRPASTAPAPRSSACSPCAGRVVVTGLGKSGLVGAKLAATLASTGTPALFVHAADALHGDAGMVGADDLLLAISKSGSTAEVVRFAEVVSARGVEVVAMTGCGGVLAALQASPPPPSTSASGAEADPFDLVPTTSTAVTAGGRRCAGRRADGGPRLRPGRLPPAPPRRRPRRPPRGRGR